MEKLIEIGVIIGTEPSYLWYRHAGNDINVPWSVH